MTQSDREVISLRMFEELKFQEVAERLGGNEISVKMQFRRALNKLKSSIKLNYKDISMASLVLLLVNISVEKIWAMPIETNLNLILSKMDGIKNVDSTVAGLRQTQPM